MYKYIDAEGSFPSCSQSLFSLTSLFCKSFSTKISFFLFFRVLEDFFTPSVTSWTIPHAAAAVVRSTTHACGENFEGCRCSRGWPLHKYPNFKNSKRPPIHLKLNARESDLVPGWLPVWSARRNVAIAALSGLEPRNSCSRGYRFTT